MERNEAGDGRGICRERGLRESGKREGGDEEKGGWRGRERGVLNRDGLTSAVLEEEEAGI